MESTALNFFVPLLLTLLTALTLPSQVTSSVGINYGQLGNNLPAPENVVPLVKSVGATRVKLYDANPQILHAFAGTGVEFIVGLGNEYLNQMTDPAKAQDWVKQNVQAYLPATKIVSIAVGNEVLTFNQTSLTGCLFPAMQNIHEALVTLGLNKKVYVTTAHSLAVLEQSYPPSVSLFRRDLVDFITPILDFHMKTGSPMLINAYPYFAYKENPKHVPLDFVLFQSDEGFVDPGTKFHYENMLFAQVDAMYHALDSVGFKKLPIVVSETGWPSNGDPDEAGATCDNAKKYNGNLMKMMMTKKMRTPIRPDCDLSIYVFALFNENLKPGPASERNYGLFKPDGTPVYSLGFKISDVSKGGGGGGSSGGGGGGNSSSGSRSPPSFTENPPMPDYLSISHATEKAGFFVSVFLVFLMFIMKQIL